MTVIDPRIIVAELEAATTIFKACLDLEFADCLAIVREARRLVDEQTMHLSRSLADAHDRKEKEMKRP